MKEREEGLGRGMTIEWPNKRDGKATRKRGKEIGKVNKGKEENFLPIILERSCVRCNKIGRKFLIPS
jgi:hypothetical protein